MFFLWREAEAGPRQAMWRRNWTTNSKRSSNRSHELGNKYIEQPHFYVFYVRIIFYERGGGGKDYSFNIHKNNLSYFPFSKQNSASVICGSRKSYLTISIHSQTADIVVDVVLDNLSLGQINAKCVTYSCTTLITMMMSEHSWSEYSLLYKEQQ